VHPRLLIVSLLVLLEIFILLGGAASETGMPDFDAYVVGQNDTLSSIATQYGIPVDYLAQFNKLNSASPLNTGQILLVPKVNPSTQTLPSNATPATAPTPTGEQIEGVMATVTAAKTEIWSKPGGGVLIYTHASQGMDLLVTGQTGTYYAVLMADGSTGFVPKAGVTLSDNHVKVDKPAPTARTAQPAATTSSASPANIGRPDLVQTAFEYLGIPYKYGGHLPKSIDCSLFVQTVFGRHGIKMPRTAAQQFTVGTPVDVQELVPGDRLYFQNRSGNIIHTAIYIGNGQFIHASSNRGAVAVDELTNPTYWRKYAGARR